MIISNPRTICEPIIHEIMHQGETKGHGRDAWYDEPVTMHLMKGTRHGLTAIGMIDHPTFVKDKETALQHIDQAIARMAFARAILTDKPDGDYNENQQDLFTQNASTESQGSAECSNVGNDNNAPRELTREYETCEGCSRPLGGDGSCTCASL